MDLTKYIDHTLLKPGATKDQVDQVIQEALDYHFYSVVVNPYWVSRVYQAVKGSNVKTTTVIGFPLGANTTKIKVAEANQAIEDGADEIDMVMNIGELISGNLKAVEDDIKAVVAVTHKQKRLIKVIIETALLSDDQIVTASKIVAKAGADFVKTSTGFSTRGASIKDIELMKKAVDDSIKIKAAGGIHTSKEAEAMIKAGASRLGTSSSLRVIGVIGKK